MTKSELRYAADKAAEVRSIDPERRKAFLDGVAWAAERFVRSLEPSIYEDIKGYPKAHMDNLKLRGFRNTLEKFFHARDID